MKHGDDAAVPRRVSSRLSARTTTTTTSSTASVATTHDPTPVPSSCIDTTSLLLERHTVDAREPAQIAGDAHIAVDHDQVDAAHAVTAHAAVTAIEIVDLVSPVDDEPVTNNATGDGNVLAVQVDEVASDDDELPAYGAHLLSRVTPVSSKRRQRTTVVEEEEVAAADERRRVARTMREGGVAVTAVANTAATAATTATTNSPVPSNSSSSDDERHSTAKRKPRPAARPVARPAIAASGSNPIDDWYSVSVRMPTVSLRKHLVHTPAAAGAATAADNANINGDESGAGKTHDMETLTNLDKKALAFQRRLLRQASRASSTEDAVKDAMSSTGNTTNALLHLLANDDLSDGSFDNDDDDGHDQSGFIRHKLKKRKTEMVVDLLSSDDAAEEEEKAMVTPNKGKSEDEQQRRRRKSVSLTPPPQDLIDQAVQARLAGTAGASSATSLLAIADRLQPTSAAELWDADNDDDDELRMFMSRGGSSSNAVATTSGAGTGQSSDTVVYVRVRAIEDERNPLPRKSFKFKVKMNDTLERLHSKYVEFTQYPGNIQLLFRGVKILTYVTPASFPRGGRGSDDEALVLDAVVDSFLDDYLAEQASGAANVVRKYEEEQRHRHDVTDHVIGVEDQEVEEEEEEEEDAWIRIKTSTIDELAEAYRARCKLEEEALAATLELSFDGDRLAGETTLEEAGVEDGDQIDARW